MRLLSVLFHGACGVRCTELYLSCVYMPHCLLLQMSSKLGCHVLAALPTMFQGAACAKEPCDNSATGDVSSSLNSPDVLSSSPKITSNLISYINAFLGRQPYEYACVCSQPLMIITSPMLSITLHYCPLPRQGSTISEAISW